MNDHQARTISTVAVWVSTAFLFIFGVFHYNWSGLLAGVLWLLLAVALAVAPAAATKAIWSRPPSPDAPKSEPPEPPKS